MKASAANRSVTSSFAERTIDALCFACIWSRGELQRKIFDELDEIFAFVNRENILKHDCYEGERCSYSCTFILTCNRSIWSCSRISSGISALMDISGKSSCTSWVEVVPLACRTLCFCFFAMVNVMMQCQWVEQDVYNCSRIFVVTSPEN